MSLFCLNNFKTNDSFALREFAEFSSGIRKKHQENDKKHDGGPAVFSGLPFQSGACCCRQNKFLSVKEVV